MRVTACAVILALAGCDGGGTAGGDGGTTDAALDAPACAVPAMNLPDYNRPPWAIAVAADGTTFVATNDVNRAIGRWQPGQSTFDPGWLALPEQPWIWQFAHDPASGALYVGASSGLWRVDPDTTPPQVELLAPGQVRAVTVGPGGEPYYTSPGAAAGDIVRRWTTSGAVEVSTSAWSEASDLLFETDGTVLISDLLTGLDRLTLDAGQVEIGRARILDVAPDRINAIGRDSDGRYYIGFQFEDGLQRYDPSFATRDDLGVGSPVRDLAFARGFLGCTSLQVVVGEQLVSVELGTTGLP